MLKRGDAVRVIYKNSRHYGEISIIIGIWSEGNKIRYEIDREKGLWWEESSFDPLYRKDITFDTLKSVCANWMEGDRETKHYNKIRCSITEDFCREGLCPVVTIG